MESLSFSLYGSFRSSEFGSAAQSPLGFACSDRGYDIEASKRATPGLPIRVDNSYKNSPSSSRKINNMAMLSSIVDRAGECIYEADGGRVSVAPKHDDGRDIDLGHPGTQDCLVSPDIPPRVLPSLLRPPPGHERRTNTGPSKHPGGPNALSGKRVSRENKKPARGSGSHGQGPKKTHNPPKKRKQATTSTVGIIANIDEIQRLNNLVDFFRDRLQKLEDESKTMKIINQRQNQAIKKMDRDQAGLPSVLSGLHDELRVLKVERKIHIEKLIAADKRSQTQTEESVRLQEIVAKLKELLKARNLEGVDKLQEHIKRLRDELEARDNKVEELTRKVASSEHLRNMELREIRSKYSKLAKECERLREESGKLAAQVQEKDRKIAAMSIYNNIHRPRQRTMSMSTDMVCELPTDDEPNPGSLRTLSETTPYPDLPFRLAYSLPGSIRAPSNLSLQSGISLSNDLLTLERLNELGWSLSPPPANFDEDDSLEAKTGAAAAEEQVDDSAAQEIPACFPHTDIPLDGIPEEHCDRADEDDDLGCHGNDTLGGLSVPSDPAKTPLKLSGGDEAVYGHDFHSPSASPVASGSAKGSGDSPADDSQHALAMDSAGTGQAQEQEHTETPALQHPPSTPAPASTRRFKPNLFSKMRKEPAKSAVSQEANPSIDTHDTNASTHSVVDHEPKNDVHEADADNSSHSMQSANASDESTSRGPTEDETNTPKILERLPPAHEPFRDEDGSANDHSVQLTESEAEGAMHADTDKMPPRFDEKLPDESGIEANSQRPKQPAKLGRLSNASIWLHSSTPDALPAKSNTKPPTPLESKSKPHKLDFLREAVHDGAAKAAERDAQPYIPSAMDGTPRRSRKAEKTPPSQEQSTVRDGKPRDGDPRRHKGTEKPGWLGGVPTLSKLSLHGGKPQKHA